MRNLCVIGDIVCTDKLGPEFGWFDETSVPTVFPAPRNAIVTDWCSPDMELRARVRRTWASRYQPNLLADSLFLTR